MDVLNAELRWIDNRCYRLLRVSDNSRNPEEDDIDNYGCVQEEDDTCPNLPVLHQGDSFYITIHVPKQLMGFVRGKFSRNIEDIQKNGCKVNISRDKSTTAEITLSGSTKLIVSVAYNKIESLANIARSKEDATHFISLPTNSSQIKESFLKFKDEVLSKCKGVKGVDESIFQNPNKLHLTVSMLVLLDERDKQNAINILKNCTQNILKQIGGKELTVQVKGLEYMNDDPAEVDVLYAKLKEKDDDDCLQILADSIMKEFMTENLSKREGDKVKLHITVMNSLYRDRKDDNEDDLERISFDARQILKDFKDYDFGQITISEIHISVRFTKDASTGYFIPIHKIKLNQ